MFFLGEGFEPVTSNLYVRRTLSGTFTCLNKVLVDRLKELNMWNGAVRQTLINDRGSVKNVDGLTDHDKKVFASIWETSMRSHIDMAAARQPFVDQSQSMSLWFAEPKASKISSALFHAWKKKLKTGCYYMRSRPKVEPQQVTACVSCSA